MSGLVPPKGLNASAIGTEIQAHSVRLDEIAAVSPDVGLVLVGDGSSWTGESGATARASLGLRIDTDVMGYYAGLEDIAFLGRVDGNIIVGDGTAWVAESGATARASLGLTIGSDVQAYDAELGALAAAAAGTGLIVSTGSGTAAARTITGTANQVVVTNGNGVGGNPVLSLPQDIATTSAPTFGGLTTTGAVFGAVVTVDDTDSPYAVTADDYTVIIDTTNNDVTVYAPPAASNTGRELNFSKIGILNNATLTSASGTELFGIDTSLFINQGTTIRSDGTIWHVWN